MSADNYVAVRKHNGMWHVWMVLGGYDPRDWNPKYNMDGYWHRAFKDKLVAIEYAQSICNEEIVEYGMRILEE